MARITFLGAAGTVTGSKYLLEADGARVLIDCGLFQGPKELRELNWKPLPIAPSKIHALVLTHAHIDHTGYLPRLVCDGYAGPVYATPATEALTELLLLDAAKNQQGDASYANRKGFSKHRPALPLFDVEHVKPTMKRFRTVQRGEWFSAKKPIWARYHDTGHLLGSSMIEVEIRGPGAMRLLFSGDVGRYGAPLYHDPERPPACDYLVCESTYGDRDHPAGSALDHLAAVVQAAVKRGGVLLVASFAVGRAQQLIYLLEVLMRRGRIPPLPIYLDSPMAVSGMTIYQYYAGEHDLTDGLAGTEDDPYQFDHLHLSRTTDESKQINSVGGPAVIIASSGMMIGGRILHHLKRRLPDERNTILLGGFMAEGTRGRILRDGARSLRIHGQDIPVRAAVVELSSLSGHADRSELVRWLADVEAPRKTFITHGEPHSARALADTLTQTKGWTTIVPALGESFELAGAEA